MERLRKLEEERRHYLRQNARGVLSDGELDVILAEVDEQRDELRKALREAQARQDALREPEVNFAHLNSLLLQLNGMRLGETSPEDRRRLY